MRAPKKRKRIIVRCHVPFCGSGVARVRHLDRRGDRRLLRKVELEEDEGVEGQMSVRQGSAGQLVREEEGVGVSTNYLEFLECSAQLELPVGPRDPGCSLSRAAQCKETAWEQERPEFERAEHVWAMMDWGLVIFSPPPSHVS